MLDTTMRRSENARLHNHAYSNELVFLVLIRLSRADRRQLKLQLKHWPMQRPNLFQICNRILYRSNRRSLHLDKRSKKQRTTRRASVERLEIRQMLAADIASDMRVSPYFFIGDHSRSNSESWQMNVSGVGSISAGFGQVTRVRATLQAGDSHLITVQHLGTNRTKTTSQGNSEPNPDYDYRAWIDDRATPAWTDGQSTPLSTKWFV